MEDLICLAYVVIEFRNIVKYSESPHNQNLAPDVVYLEWCECTKAYRKLSLTFTDKEIVRMQNFVVSEL